MEAKDITDNKKFWKTVKAFVANTNSNSRNKITLHSKKDYVISNSKDVPEIFNTFL